MIERSFRRWCVPASLAVSTAFAAAACSRAERPAPETASTEANAGAVEAPSKPRPSGEQRVATLAGGCFWGMEELLRKQPGVLDTEVGYTGGTVKNPRYGDVTTGRSGHAEAIRVVYDPKKTSYEKLLLYFFRIHDPTTLNRQGNDVGTQYRSAIFVHDAEQRKTAERVKKRVDESGEWSDPVTTEIVEAGPFTAAESYHQDYLQKKPNGYTCHYERPVQTY